VIDTAAAEAVLELRGHLEVIPHCSEAAVLGLGTGVITSKLICFTSASVADDCKVTQSALMRCDVLTLIQGALRSTTYIKCMQTACSKLSNWCQSWPLIRLMYTRYCSNRAYHWTTRCVTSAL
jgi:hypothetical protein